MNYANFLKPIKIYSPLEGGGFCGYLSLTASKGLQIKICSDITSLLILSQVSFPGWGNGNSTTAKSINAPCSSEIVRINSLSVLLTLHGGLDISIIHSQIRSSVCTKGYQVYHLLHLPKCYFWKG